MRSAVSMAVCYRQSLLAAKGLRSTAVDIDDSS